MHALDQRTLEKLHAKTSKPLDGNASTILNDIGTTVRDLVTFGIHIKYAHVLTFFLFFFFRSVIGSLVGKPCKIIRLIGMSSRIRQFPHARNSFDFTHSRLGWMCFRHCLVLLGHPKSPSHGRSGRKGKASRYSSTLSRKWSSAFSKQSSSSAKSM